MTRRDSQGRPLPIKTADDLAADTAEALAVIRGYGATGQKMYQSYRASVQRITSDARIAAVVKREQLAALRQQYLEEVRDLEKQGQNALETLRATHQQTRQPTGDATEQLLRVTQEAAAWRRAEKLHAAGQEWLQIIHDAGARGDTSMLAALSQELPAELAGMDQRQPGYSAAIRQQLRAAEQPHISEVERAVREQEQELSYLQGAFDYNRRSLQDATESATDEERLNFLMGATKGETLPMNERAADALKHIG